MRSSRNCSHSTSPVARLASEQIRWVVRDLVALDARLARVAEALGPKVKLAASPSVNRVDLAAEIKQGINAVRHDLLADAIATLKGLARLQPDDLKRRQAEEDKLLERLGIVG